MTYADCGFFFFFRIDRVLVTHHNRKRVARCFFFQIRNICISPEYRYTNDRITIMVKRFFWISRVSTHTGLLKRERNLFRMLLFLLFVQQKRAKSLFTPICNLAPKPSALRSQIKFRAPWRNSIFNSFYWNNKRNLVRNMRNMA